MCVKCCFLHVAMISASSSPSHPSSKHKNKDLELDLEMLGTPLFTRQAQAPPCPTERLTQEPEINCPPRAQDQTRYEGHFAVLNGPVISRRAVT